MGQGEGKKPKSKRRLAISRKAVFGVSLLVIVLAAGAYAAYTLYYRVCCAEPPLDIVVVENPDGQLVGFPRGLDGELVPELTEQFPIVTAVVLDNHPDSRPQSGLADASVVYEIPVEGIFTRFLALYPMYPSAGLASVTSTYDGDIGPVRSARPYMLDVAAEYDAIFAHVGGSPTALTQLKSGTIADINEFSRGHLFWRSTQNVAPHNVMTSLEDLEDGHAQYFSTQLESEFVPWEWNYDLDDVQESDESQVAIVSIAWKDTSNFVEWEWDQDAGQFNRYQNNTRHRDAASSAIVADTVIVQRVDTAVIDDVGRLAIDMVGSGDVTVYRDGIKIEGTWNKDRRLGRTTFVDKDNLPIALAPGKIWVEVVPQTIAVDEIFEIE